MPLALDGITVIFQLAFFEKRVELGSKVYQRVRVRVIGKAFVDCQPLKSSPRKNIKSIQFYNKGGSNSKGIRA